MVKELFKSFISFQGEGLDDEKLRALTTMVESGDFRYFNWVRDVFEEIHVKERGHKNVLIWKDMNTDEELSVTYLEMDVMANKVLNVLRKHGLKKGDPVYLMTKVHPLHWASFLALVKGGMIIVPTATNLTSAELKYRFSDLRPSAIIADLERSGVVDDSLGSLKVPKFLINGKREGWNDLEEESTNAEPENTEKDDVIINYFTSGTTGMPKRVIHTAVSYPVGSITTASIIGVKESDYHLNLSATGWAKFAWSSFFSPLLVGATVVAINYEGKLDAKKYLAEVESLGVTSFCAPPTAWRQFVTLDLSQFKLEKLRSVVSAGEPLNPEVIKTWRDKFGTTIRDFYGQTETTAIIGNFPFMKVKPGSMGKPHPLYNVVLVDDEGKEISKPYETGHIAIRINPRPIGLFMGYSDERKNAESFRNGLYYTGDKAYVDDEGYFYFVGRGDDVIKTSDYRVGPFEVESALLEHEAVAEAAVIGVSDPVRWQLVKAFVVLKKGYSPSEELALAIRDKVKTILSPYKIPRVIEFVDELPKTISGKIRRVELRKTEEDRKRRGERGKYEYFLP
ncbi:acyl--CoA ligase [Metallosphaera tengchongensis]|uniref:Acyl--CoA ligase n=1 Tax=Metallosphaera tengchongensis TaxID=1532350 RepID=A0A6N0NTP0_9CREN|nr:acyl--CoA ligase [Metallosphaera tengchongensis]QKR00234.1 acyl--CoA ligase [Metallosphaera tengchongensis]